MPRPFALGGVVASILLIAIGIGSVVIGMNGRSDVRDSIRLEKISGTPDMTPALISNAVAEAGLTGVTIPDCSVANQPIDTGAKARCFAEYVRIHALEVTGGKVYAEMEREDPVRDTWVTATALSTALNTSYFAEQVGLFSMVIGFALILVGIGFLVLMSSLLRGGAAARTRAARISADPQVAA